MPDERLARDRFGLSSARLVVREEEIDTTAMEVDRGSQLTQGEGAAFDVPPRPATPPSGPPRRLAIVARTPQHEIERVALTLDKTPVELRVSRCSTRNHHYETTLF